MAICVAGDFDPDEMIEVIQRHFGDMQPNAGLPELAFAPEQPIETPVVKDINGPEAAFVALGWRFPGAATREAELLNLVAQILFNRQT